MDIVKQKNFEDKIFNMCFDNNEQLSKQILAQYKNSIVTSRSFDDVGFYTVYEVLEKKLKIDNLNEDFGNFTITYNGIDDAFGFVIMITNGYLNYLECYTIMADVWSYDYDNFIFKVK